MLRAVVLLRNTLAFYGGYLLLVAIHELAHWIAAQFSHFATREFQVGPLRWKDITGLKLCWHPKFLFSGRVLLTPNPDDRFLRIKWVMVISAAPLANIAAGVLFLVFIPTDLRNTATGIGRWLAFCSVVLGFLNLIPSRVGRLGTDGKQIFELLFGAGEERLRFKAFFLQHASALENALRDSDWSTAHAICDSCLQRAGAIPNDDEVLIALINADTLAKRGLSDRTQTSNADL